MDFATSSLHETTICMLKNTWKPLHRLPKTRKSNLHRIAIKLLIKNMSSHLSLIPKRMVMKLFTYNLFGRKSSSRLCLHNTSSQAYDFLSN